MLPMLGTIIYINLFNSYNCIRCLHAHPVGKEVSAQRSVLLRAMQGGKEHSHVGLGLLAPCPGFPLLYHLPTLSQVCANLAIPKRISEVPLLKSKP